MKLNIAVHLISVVFLSTSFLATSCSKKEIPEPKTYKFDPLDEQGKSATTAPESDHETKDAATEPTNELAEGTKATKKKSRHGATSSAAPDGQKYIVQIGAFTKRENAEQLLKALQDKKYPVFIKTLGHKEFGTMFLVRLKPTTDRAEAEKLRARLKESEQLSPTLIIPKE